MKYSKHVLKLTVPAMLVALGVVISPILRVEGMCPMAHFINIVCAVLMGPWYSLLCAGVIGVIRMATMGIPPLALTGAIFGAFFSGLFYRLSKGRLLAAVLGEIFGTGILGALVSYPVMKLLWGRTGLTWIFYVPSFTLATLIGGSIAYVFLRRLTAAGLLATFQEMLDSESYKETSTVFSESLTLAAFGAVLYLAIKLAVGFFAWTSPVWNGLAYALPAFCVVAAVIYYFVKSKAQAGEQAAAAVPLHASAEASPSVSPQASVATPASARTSARDRTPSSDESMKKREGAKHVES